MIEFLRKFSISPAILKTFYSGAIESIDSVNKSASQCGMEKPQIRTAKLCRELCTWLSASQDLLFPLKDYKFYSMFNLDTLPD